jgi:excisionase family DNA binding protein
MSSSHRIRLSQAASLASVSTTIEASRSNPLRIGTFTACPSEVWLSSVTVMSGSYTELVLTEPTWVTVDDAARYAGVSRSTVSTLCAKGRVPSRTEGRRKLVHLEKVLSATTGKDIEALRRRLQRMATNENVPDAVRDWGEALLGVLDPVLERLVAAERRALAAEAKLEILSRQLEGDDAST